jgi:hypothetical protein
VSALERTIKRATGYGDIVRTKKKPSGIKAAVKYADSWFAKYIVLRDKHCVTCGSTENLQCSHLYRRVHYSTRWTEDNAAAQCKGCHFRHHNDSEHPLTRYIEGKMGRDDLETMWLLSKRVSKFSADTIKAFGDSFQDRCKEME